jgi:hypothetical protein
MSAIACLRQLSSLWFVLAVHCEHEIVLIRVTLISAMLLRLR